MSSLMKSMGSLTSMFGMGRSAAGLPPLPSGLGLPERSKSGYVGVMKGEIAEGPTYTRERAKAEAFNKAFANLLNNQPQLSGAERSEIYGVYSDKFVGNKGRDASNNPLTNYGKTLSSAAAMTKEQIAAAQQPKPAAKPAAKPAVAAPKPVQTVGPVAKPQTAVPAPPPTPTVSTPTGKIAGATQTIGQVGTDTGGRRGRRGRLATLLTGLGGAVEQFGS